MLTAADIMTTKIHTVHLDTEIKALAKTFVEHNVNAMPVLDDAGMLVGMVTQTDLVEQDKPMHIPTVISLSLTGLSIWKAQKNSWKRCVRLRRARSEKFAQEMW